MLTNIVRWVGHRNPVPKQGGALAGDYANLTRWTEEARCATRAHTRKAARA
jgi:hypothetical protein